MAVEPILRVKDLHTFFYQEEGVIKAVDGVSFDLYPDKVLGIVGETGSGKSVTAKSIMRLIFPPGKIAGGHILYKGKDLARLSEKDMLEIRGKRISMIFQDPMTSLNPLFTIGDQLVETIRFHQKLDKEVAKNKAIEMLDKVGVPNPEERLRSYPFEFSGGMRQRVVIAIALSCDPDILIADEPTTSVDVTIQAQILDLIKTLQRQFHTAVIFITHDLGVVAEIADEIMVLYGGKTMELASTDVLFENPLHPYTVGLFNCIPRVDRKISHLDPIPGQPPQMIDVPSVCPFLPRCPVKTEQCKQALPDIVEVEPDHFVRCFKYTRDKINVGAK
ncbi:MAG: ABC transporter ATP-binding protein [Thermotogae bacterium]|nr:ABC transporter ATP-binding protein [Thermotogota bacterium]